jgi:predicted Zn-dependent protease
MALIAVSWQQQHFWRDSDALLTRAVSIEPGNVPARVQLAVVKLRAGDAAVAEYHLRDAIATDPDSAVAWSNLGSTLRMLARPEEAIAAFQRALELDPSDYAPALNLGSLLVESGRAAEAIPVLESAAALRDEDGSATAQLIAAYNAVGRADDARRALADGLERYPANSELIALLEKLRR